MEEAGFEPAERNAGVDTGTRVVHPDFHWPARKLCLEADGSVHKTTRKFYEDRWRDRELFLIGISTLRYTDEDVYAAGPATLEERAGSSTAPARPG